MKPGYLLYVLAAICSMIAAYFSVVGQLEDAAVLAVYMCIAMGTGYFINRVVSI